MVKFKIDENLPAEAAMLLREAGYDVRTILDQDMQGARDTEVSNACRTEERALITLDLDFADLRSFPPEQHPGIVVIKATLQTRARILELIQSLIKALEVESPKGCLWILDATALRIRGEER